MLEIATSLDYGSMESDKFFTCFRSCSVLITKKCTMIRQIISLIRLWVLMLKNGWFRPFSDLAISTVNAPRTYSF